MQNKICTAIDVTTRIFDKARIYIVYKSLDKASNDVI